MPAFNKGDLIQIEGVVTFVAEAWIDYRGASGDTSTLFDKAMNDAVVIKKATPPLPKPGTLIEGGSGARYVVASNGDLTHISSSGTVSPAIISWKTIDHDRVRVIG